MIDYDKHRATIFAKKGGWRIGTGIETHGYSLLDDILGKCSLFQVMIMNVTGRLPERRLADLVEGLFICSSWPDARIWCNKMGAFSAATRTSPTAAVAAGGLAGDSRLYGSGTGRAINDFAELANFHVRKQGMPVADFVDRYAYKNGKLQAPGFARPLAKGDERIPALRNYASSLGFEPGPYEDLANRIEDCLSQRDGEGMNSAGYFVCFMKDRGFSVEHIMGIAAWSIATGVYASYFEYIDQDPDVFLPLKVADIDYIGPPRRSTPPRDE